MVDVCQVLGIQMVTVPDFFSTPQIEENSVVENKFVSGIECGVIPRIIVRNGRPKLANSVTLMKKIKSLNF